MSDQVNNEDKLHKLAILFMNQFNYKKLSLDEYLLEYKEYLTEDELKLGYHILSMF